MYFILVRLGVQKFDKPYSNHVCKTNCSLMNYKLVVFLFQEYIGTIRGKIMIFSSTLMSVCNNQFIGKINLLLQLKHWTALMWDFTICVLIKLWCVLYIILLYRVTPFVDCGCNFCIYLFIVLSMWLNAF